jgi:predicted kinase
MSIDSIAKDSGSGEKFILEKPTLCMFVGVPGSGKSTLALKVAYHLSDAAFISKDMIQSAFTSTDRLLGETYSYVTGPTVHLLASFADIQLSLGKTPIIDAPYSRNHNLTTPYRDWVDFYKAAAKKHDARLAIIRCLPPSDDELRQRIQKRVDDGTHPWDKKLKLDNWEGFLAYEPADFPIRHDDVLNLVTDRPAEELCRGVLIDYLGAKLLK